MIKSFRDIEAYQRSKQLYPQVVKLTKDFPPAGFHLRDQVCRSGNAIHSDIAEGYGRSVSEFKMYLTRALGSNNETISHLEDARNANFCAASEADSLITEYTIVGKQIYRLKEHWH